MIRSNTFCAAVAAAVLIFAPIAVAQNAPDNADDDSIALEKTPAPVQETIKKMIGTNKIESLSKDTDDGETTYDLEFEANDKSTTATISSDGTIVSQESEIDLKDLPPKVSAAIKKSHPDGTADDAEMIVEEGKTVYDISLTEGADKRDLTISAAGKLISDDLNEDEDATDEKDDAPDKPDAPMQPAQPMEKPAQ